jgi:hypothetical protein
VSTDYSDIRHILPRPGQVIGVRAPGTIAAAILDADLDRDAIALEQKRWVRAHASIEKATHNLEQVYRRYVRSHALANAA